MFEFFITDTAGKRYRVNYPSRYDYNRLPINSTLSTKLFLQRFSEKALIEFTQQVIEKAGFFLRSSIQLNAFRKDPVSTPPFGQVLFTDADLVRQAIVNGELCVYPYDESAQVEKNIVRLTEGMADLRYRISQALADVLILERQETVRIEKLLSECSGFQQAATYAGGFLTRLGVAAWDSLVWTAEAVEAVHPAKVRHRLIQSLIITPRTENHQKETANNFLTAQKKEFVDVLGFDPSEITREMFDQAVELAKLIWEDSKLRWELITFAKDYAKAQHRLVLIELAGSAAFELLITIILAVLTGGTGGAAMLASKTRLVTRFKKVGDLFLELAKKTNKLKRAQRNKGTKVNRASFKDFEVVDDAYIPKPMERQPSRYKGSSKSEKNKKDKTTANKAYYPESLPDAQVRLAKRRKQIAAEGYKPKYSDAELKDMAHNGDVGGERFQARFMETNYLVNRDASNEHLSGSLGRPMEGKSGKGAKYWSTSFDQIEDADTDPKLISEKLGLTYNPEKDYTLIIVDTQKATPITGVKSVSATFENVSEFGNKELPKKIPKSFTDKVMTRKFQDKYSTHYKAAESSGYFKEDWSKESFSEYLDSTTLDSQDKMLLKQRFEMHSIIGNNEDYLGSGLTKNNNARVNKDYGVVETLNFERQEINLSALHDAGAVTIIPNLRPL